MKRLELRRVAFERDATTVLDTIDLQVDTGELLGIIGPNGAGKTTLLKLLAGLLTPARGSVAWDGEPLDRMEARTRARIIGFHGQDPEVHWPLAVADILALGRLPWRAAGTDDAAAIASAVAHMHLDALLSRRSDSLSGGELARVHMARLLAGTHELLCVDEPTANLDPRFQLEILTVLRDHTRGGGACALVLHDLALAARFCDRLVVVADGRIAADGDPRTVLTPSTVEAVYAVPRGYNQWSGIDAALAARKD